MSLLNIAIPNLLNGVSQQPPNIRFQTQCELQENAYSSVVEGLGKRPPTEHIARLDSTAGSNSYVHTIERGDGIEKYVVVITNGSIKVFDMNTGAEKTVALDTGASTYISSNTTGFNPATAFKAISVADYTFIVNTEKVPALTGDSTPLHNGESLIWIKQGAYSSKYTISGTYGTGTAFSYSFTTKSNTRAVSDSATTDATVDGEVFTKETAYADSTWIAANFNNILPQVGTPDFNSTRVGSSIRLAPNVSMNYTVTDGLMGMVNQTVQAFEDLPAYAIHNMVVKVEGLPETGADDYWVKFTSKNGTSMGEGTWAETLGNGCKYRLDYSTMPHVLIRLPAGSGSDFVLKRANGAKYQSVTGTDAVWADRKVGDDETNPVPSFVGKNISDIFLFRGRLGILAGESVVLSEAGTFFNFWRTSVTKLLDSDPIDLSSSYPEITLFRHAVPFSERLVLFSDHVQFVLGTKQAILTASNVSLTPISNYDTLKDCRPVVTGDQIYFTFDRGSYSGVRQMVANENDSNLLNAPDISAHVPKYIAGKIMVMAASNHDNIMACLADGDQSVLYIYKWFDSGNERVQSSWSKWTFKNGTGSVTIRGISWLGTSLYVVVQRPTGLYLEKITVEPNRKDPNSQFVTCLDRRVGYTVDSILAYDAVTDRTTFTVSNYQVTAGAQIVVTRKAYTTGTPPVAQEGGRVVPLISATNNSGTNACTFVVSGDWRYIDLWIGEQYTMKYRFSQPYLKQNDGNRTVSMASGRFQIRAMLLAFNSSSFFKALVSNKYNDSDYEYIWTGNVLGSGQSTIGTVPVESGSFRFPVYGKNDEMIVEIQNNTHLPSSFMSAEIEASYDARSRRV